MVFGLLHTGKSTKELCESPHVTMASLLIELHVPIDFFTKKEEACVEISLNTFSRKPMRHHQSQQNRLQHFSLHQNPLQDPLLNTLQNHHPQASPLSNHYNVSLLSNKCHHQHAETSWFLGKKILFKIDFTDYVLDDPGTQKELKIATEKSVHSSHKAQSGLEPESTLWVIHGCS